MKNSIIGLIVALLLVPSAVSAQTSPSRDALVLQLIAILTEQVKLLQFQLAELQEQTTQQSASQVTTSATNTIAVKAAEARTPREASLSTSTENVLEIDAVPELASDGYAAVPVLAFELVGQDDSFDLRSLSAKFKIDGVAKITKAYLYQGNKTPVASAAVSKGVAIFNIPESGSGSQFGPGIPVEYTIKVDITDLEEAAMTLKVCPTYQIGRDYYVEPGYQAIHMSGLTGNQLVATVPASFTVTVGASDVKLYDTASNPVTVSGSAMGSVQISRYRSLNKMCATSIHLDA